MAAEDITCRELVELVTEYDDGALTRADRARFEEHLADCEGCETYVEQLRATVRSAGRLDAGVLEPAARERLLVAFRDWKHARGAGGA